MKLANLRPTQREALIALVQHGALRRTREGYRPAQPGAHAYHTTRTVCSLAHSNLAQWTDGSLELQPTAEGRRLVSDGVAAAGKSGSIAA
jgi:hypothetical protein